MVKCYLCYHERVDHDLSIDIEDGARCGSSNCDCLGFVVRSVAKEKFIADLRGYKLDFVLADVEDGGRQQTAWICGG